MTIRAMTADGRPVLLFPDGKWKFAEEEQPVPPKESAFRRSAWGDSMIAVREAESLPLVHETQSILAFSGKVADLDCLIAYIFAEDQLVRGKYQVTQQHSNSNLHIADRERLHGLLTQKYGQPKQHDTMWLNDLYRDDTSEWGTAIGAGHLIFLTRWETTETIVSLVLSGDNFDISLAVEYASGALARLADSVEERAHLSDL